MGSSIHKPNISKADWLEGFTISAHSLPSKRIYLTLLYHSLTWPHFTDISKCDQIISLLSCLPISKLLTGTKRNNVKQNSRFELGSKELPLVIHYLYTNCPIVCNLSLYSGTLCNRNEWKWLYHTEFFRIKKEFRKKTWPMLEK